MLRWNKAELYVCARHASDTRLEVIGERHLIEEHPGIVVLAIETLLKRAH